ncbi:hypothetical protein P4S63_17410 [Pseudoalteromonas sp. B193]
MGLLVYGNGGMNTEYGAESSPEGTFYAGTTGVDLKQLFISPTVSYELNEQTRLGVSPIYVVQQFEAQGLGNFAPFSQSPQALTNNGTDTSTGLGIQLGISQDMNSSLSWGQVTAHQCLCKSLIAIKVCLQSKADLICQVRFNLVQLISLRQLIRLYLIGKNKLQRSKKYCKSNQ